MRRKKRGNFKTFILIDSIESFLYCLSSKKTKEKNHSYQTSKNIREPIINVDDFPQKNNFASERDAAKQNRNDQLL